MHISTMQLQIGDDLKRIEINNVRLMMGGPSMLLPLNITWKVSEDWAFLIFMKC